MTTLEVTRQRIAVLTNEQLTYCIHALALADAPVARRCLLEEYQGRHGDQAMDRLLTEVETLRQWVLEQIRETLS